MTKTISQVPSSRSRWKILGKILAIVLSIIAVVVIFVLVHFKFSPRIGSDPTGERLQRLQASPHYADGKFKNPIETNMDIPLRAMGSVIWENLTGGAKRRPAGPLPTVAFDGSLWQSLPDSSYSIAWFGHSTVLVKMNGLTILCDPVFSERASSFSFIGPKRFDHSHLHELAQLPPIDAVLLSHDHYDHLDYESVLGLKDKVPLWITPLGVGAHLEHWGVPHDRIRELDLWESTSLGELSFDLVPTRHFSGRGLTNRFSTLWGGWVIRGSEHQLLFGGDSGYTPTFAQIGERFGRFDLVMLECGAYNELWSDIHMMPEEVATAAKDLNADALMPIHWGKFDLALHHWKEPIQRLSNQMTGQDIRLFTPRIGAVSTNADRSASSEWWIDVE
jgi:L-ascorbate metabolism protein UlaG (beta-lactamase superfamily)